MPMSGGTRMLRARRKDCNVKPNRRLDRKSSRGMLFENEELRMRTITINAEVEQGQHALKKLRRENEQLRREMWCLRDEYDKMEKLLRKKEEDEDSDQENSDSDDNYSRTEDSDEEKMAVKKSSEQEETLDLENEENLQKSSDFGNGANVRTFDGLSVIDEQTEETQTTESAAGYGTLSRGNSANRTFAQAVPVYEEACGVPYGCPSDSFGSKAPGRKKGVCPYEDGPGFSAEWNADQCDTFDVRPASPYPYNGSLQRSYQKRFQVLQQLAPPTPESAVGENGWIFPDPSKEQDIPDYDMYVNDPNNYMTEKPSNSEFCSLLPQPNFGFNLIQDRAGPDVFVTDVYPQAPRPEILPTLKEKVGEEEEALMNNMKDGIDKIDISEKSEKDPKMQKMTSLTESVVSRSGAGLTIVPGETQETLDPGKLTMDEAVAKNDNEISKHDQHLVSCQNSSGQDVCETNEEVPDLGSKNLPTDEMPQGEKPASSKFQTKLTVTLKSPGAKPEGRLPKKVPSPVPPKNFQHQLRFGIRPEYAMGQRFQTFPSPGFQPNVRVPVANGRDCLVNHYAGVRMPGFGLSGSLPRLPNLLPTNEICLNPSNIPDDLEKDLDVLPDEESLPVPVAQPLVKPVKIPPAPPPRTSSCPKTIIPVPLVGVTAQHHRTLRRGKPLHIQDPSKGDAEPVIYNPLLLSQPIATSSPTISLRGTKYGINSSNENLYKCRKSSFNEESSLEDFSRQKSRLREELNRVDVPRLNKSVSSPSFGSFRTLRRKQSEALASSVENIMVQKIPEAILEKTEKKTFKGHSAQNNISMSSSSGLDSPTKSDRRKRRVSIQFKKKGPLGEGKQHVEDDGKCKDATDSRRESIVPGILLVKGSDRHKMKNKIEETDATTSERERTNSVSSRTSSVVAGSSRRKFSISSNRTYINDEKIPWCGCWGNGCV